MQQIKSVTFSTSMPTVIPHQQTLGWTMCSMLNIYALIHTENAQRLLMQGYADMWCVMLQISEDAWVAKTHSPANCTPTWCYGMVVCYVPQVIKVLFSFHVLPVLIDSNFLKPQIDGIHTDEAGQ